jgi:riboflavin biosynthesis pyrimidine reductase
VIQATFGLAKFARATDAQSLADSYGSWSGVRSNHVVSSSGSFSGGDGSSRSISTKEDRELLLALRACADLIVVDAATARLEKYRAPKSKTSLAIFSLAGDFTDIPAVETSELPTYLFTANHSPRFPPNPNALIVSVTDRPFDGFLAWAKIHALDAILLEAGPNLTSKAFQAKIVRQSAVTRTGDLTDLDPEVMANPFDSQAKLVSLAQAKGASFSLWSH